MQVGAAGGARAGGRPTGSRSRDQSPRKETQQDGEVKLTVQQAREQLKAGKEQGMPALILAMLQENLEAVEAETDENKPIGKRLDATRWCRRVPMRQRP